MIAGLIAVSLGLGALAWYLQRPLPRDLRLSFARLLPDPPKTQIPTPRFALMPPIRSAAFWLHLGAVCLAVAAIWADWRVRSAVKDPSIGLRIVLDVSHSMSVADGSQTRFDLARAAAMSEAETARRAAGVAEYCDELVVVARSIIREDGLDGLPRAEPRREGGDVLRLLEAVRLEDDLCPITHVVILTDAPRPALSLAKDSPALRWLQIGEPAANAALTEVRHLPPRLDGTPAALLLTVETFGAIAPPSLFVTGPGGSLRPELEPSLDRPGRYLARFEPESAGRYIARLDGGGAYPADDRLIFDIDETQALAIDWRLGALAAPPGVTRREGAPLVVTDLAGLAAAPPDRAVLVTYSGWGGAASRRIGSFVEDRALLDAINFDVLERRLPRPVPGPLPEGFSPILTDEAGGVIAARRIVPPGILVPEPLVGSDTDVTNLSLTMFFSALQELAGMGETPLPARWQMADEVEIAEAWKEADTARPLAPDTDEFAYAPVPTAGPDAPIWPTLLALSLGLLLIERVWSLVRGRGHAV